MNAESLKEAIRKELPALLREDPEIRAFIMDLVRRESSPRVEIEDRFDRLLAELKRDREAQTRKWEEQRAERERDRDDQNRKWEEERAEREREREEQNRKWDEQNRKWDEQNRRWDESRREFDRVHEEIMAQARKFDRSIGALGARWGMQSEAAFRNALAGILEQSFGVQVLHVNEYDDVGTVFGRPEQVEIDVIIKNGLLLICELKSSMSKSDIYTFERKARFYEQRHERKAERLIVISPMIDPTAQKVADRLGIETYSDSVDVQAI